MKFTVAKEHRDFFRKHFRIEFSHLFSTDQCNQLMAERLIVLSERLNVSKANFKTTSASSQFMAGFDLWRGNTNLKKLILQKNLAEIAAELLEVRSLRIGFDQLIPEVPSFKSSSPDDPYKNWLSQTAPLKDICSIQGIAAGLIICLKAPQTTEESVEIAPKESDTTTPPEMATPNLFPSIPGNGVFFSPEAPLDLSELTKHRDCTYLLIVYTKATSVYCKKDHDPHTNSFRQLGYNFGDRLSDRFHPLIVF